MEEINETEVASSRWGPILSYLPRQAPWPGVCASAPLLSVRTLLCLPARTSAKTMLVTALRYGCLVAQRRHISMLQEINSSNSAQLHGPSPSGRLLLLA